MADTGKRVQNDPSAYIPGSVGELKFYTGKSTSFPNHTGMVDSAVVEMIVAANKAAFDNYNNNAANPYNKDKETYNKALKDEKERQKDLFKAAFEPAIKIPKRPCAPTPPARIPVFNVATKAQIDSETAWPTSKPATGGDGYGYLSVTGSTSVSSTFAARTANKGFIQAATDASTETVAADAGKVLGRFGQGPANFPGTAKPFQLRKVQASAKAGVMISIYPFVNNQAALASADKIDFEVTGVEWTAADSFEVPGAPATPSDPDSDGAKALAATLTAAAAVLVSLY